MDGDPERPRTRLEGAIVFASPQSRRRFVLHLAVIVVAMVAVTILLRRQLPFLTNSVELRAFVQSFGIWSPVVLVVLQALQVVLAPIPGQLLGVVAGYLFGAWWGTLYNMLGITIGSAAAFWLSRRFGRAYVEDIVHEDTLAKFDSVDDDTARLTLLLFFLIPGLPDDVLCFVGGLTKFPLWQLLVLAIVGRTPAFFLANVVGGFLGTNQFESAIAIAGALVLVSLLGYLNRDRFVRLLDGES